MREKRLFFVVKMERRNYYLPLTLIPIKEYNKRFVYRLKQIKIFLSVSFDTNQRTTPYLAISNASKKWTLPIKNWKKALNWFAQLFGDRLLNRLDTRN